ncbi:hypothetical protein PG995_010425, partial [Apiospora arundinis]
MDSNQLRRIGADILVLFRELASLEKTGPKSHLTIESERFRLWAHSLGLHQQGHTSLDYRLRDVVLVRELFVQVLRGLQDQLSNLISIARGDRPPVERQSFEKDDDASSVSTGKTSATSESASESVGGVESFHEVNYRLESLTEALDSLYSLASRIRKPSYRPQRTIHQLCKHIPSNDERDLYIQEGERKQIEIVSDMLYGQLTERLRSTDASSDELAKLVQTYTSKENWLIKRTGVANFRRKQQLIYWEKNWEDLSHPPEIGPDKNLNLPGVVRTMSTTSNLKGPTLDTPTVPSDILSERSLETFNTRPPSNIKALDDLKSEFSHTSRVSTVIGPRGETLSYPLPPSEPRKARHFLCSYCKTWCPVGYLKRKSTKSSKLEEGAKLWHNHLDHDLQPYHCTYEGCNDSGRIYGKRQDWIDHESQHRCVWLCPQDGKEFQVRSDYKSHLEQAHPSGNPDQFSDELIASAVNQSVDAYRDCPFCPSAFTDAPSMISHVEYHLKFLALFCLPHKEDEGSEVSRDESILGDFNDEEEAAFATIHDTKT